MVHGRFFDSEDEILSRIHRLRLAKSRMVSHCLENRQNDARKILTKINEITIRIAELNRVVEEYF